jgi:hypothetical protein
LIGWAAAGRLAIFFGGWGRGRTGWRVLVDGWMAIDCLVVVNIFVVQTNYFLNYSEILIFSE